MNSINKIIEEERIINDICKQMGVTE